MNTLNAHGARRTSRAPTACRRRRRGDRRHAEPRAADPLRPRVAERNLDTACLRRARRGAAHPSPPRRRVLRAGRRDDPARSGPSSSSSPPAPARSSSSRPASSTRFDNDSDGELRFLNFHAPGCNFVEYLRGRGEFDQAPPPEDGGRPASDAIVTPPGGGERFERGDRAVTIVGELPEISVLRLEVEQWPRIPVHDHDDQVDSFFVLEGEAGLVQRRRGRACGCGTFYVAAGRAHGFENLGRPSCSTCTARTPGSPRTSAA